MEPLIRNNGDNYPNKRTMMSAEYPFVAPQDTDELTSNSTPPPEQDRLSTSSSDPVCLEGILHCRKGGHSSLMWRRRFVHLSLIDGGSVTIYKDAPQRLERYAPTTALRTIYSKMHELSSSMMSNHSESSDHSEEVIRETNSSSDISMHIPAHLPWTVKDVENGSSFVLEIPTEPTEAAASGTSAYRDGDGHLIHLNDGDGASFDDLCADIDLDEEAEQALDDDFNNRHNNNNNNDETPEPQPSFREDHHLYVSKTTSVDGDLALEEALGEEISNARNRGKPLRVYFRCNKGNEKALWLQAFNRLDRLSSEVRRKKGLLKSLTTHYGVKNGRIRKHNTSHLARDVRQLELASEDIDAESVDMLNFSCNDVVEEMARGRDLKLHDKEYRVQPTYAYPHRWMTRREMREEMILPSETFHNLRVPGTEKKEIGSLRVEVLQCLGLPKLDRTAETDAIIYLVCGSYAFATDVIPNRANPMWLRKARRACEFPIYHAYASLYAGVFDDDSKRVKDEFAGRVVLNLARLRPRSTYDVTLPLRLSTSVYSRRRRGAIRLRFTVRWTTERDALMSYIPKKVHIPLPQNSRPNLDTTVLCADQKAFRNIAITVHGTHLPGKFTFQQMRAAIREINFTRKYIFTSLRTWFRETRHWQYPTISAFIFLAWMHCIYANQFSLVPAYLVLYFFFQLMSNYAKYGIDGPGNRGFVPPTWEEMLLALIRGGDPDYRAIEPLDMGLRPLSLMRRQTPESLAESPEDLGPFDYKISTHTPQGKSIFQALGFLDEKHNNYLVTEEDHLEFPFANPADYPKFTVKESLVSRKGDGTKDDYGPDCNASVSSHPLGSMHDESRMIPRLSLDMEMPDIMRKDSSGLHDFDEEEENFATRRAVVASGKHMSKKAASTITKTATGLTEMSFSTISKTATGISEVSGLHHVVSPIAKGITPMVEPIAQGISSGVSMGVHGISSGVSMGVQGISSGASMGVHGISSGVSMGVSAVSSGISGVSSGVSGVGQSLRRSGSSHESDLGTTSRHTILRSQRNASSARHSSRLMSMSMPPPILESNLSNLSDIEPLCEGEGPEPPKPPPPPEEIDPLLLFPEQNVDVEGPSTGKKITEDLDEIKEKMHEMTWNLFNDKLYVIKNQDACYFGQAKKPEKRRKQDVSKEIDKLMRTKAYSNSNPFIARVGLYVEPIIGSAYSFLCVFRAGFNVMTWRDPMLTFWVSFFSGILAVVLFIFPWRIFLFILGIFLVGPQNWVMRILREKGHLPPLPPRKPKRNPEDDFESDLPADQPVFAPSIRQQQGTTTKQSNGSQYADKDEVDPREVHRVVVPYSPLIYHRFYDWPPEPQYAQVKRDDNDAQQRRGGRRRLSKPAGIFGLGSKTMNNMNNNGLGRNNNLPRRRYNRRRTTSFAGESCSSSQQFGPTVTTSGRRRFNTVDWQENGYKAW